MIKTLSLVTATAALFGSFHLLHDGGGESAADAVAPSNSYRQLRGHARCVGFG